MSYSFTETFKVSIPDVEFQLSGFSESEYKDKHGLIVEIASIHAGTTSNFNHYTSDALTAAVSSWLTPYPKPIIMNHDKLSEPIGRVVGATMAQEEDGTPFIKLQAAITDPTAIQKVLDKRYLTGSVGGKTDEAICSICNTDWAVVRENVRQAPCTHRRGKAYKGQIATLKMGKIDFKEYSFVNMPSDTLSSIRSFGEDLVEIEEGWNNQTRFFVLDLVQEEIVEFVESENEGKDILAEMKKKDASPMYRDMKGAFIEAQILEDKNSVKGYINDTKKDDGIESNSEEKLMAQEDINVEEPTDDILAVTEGLSEEFSVVSTDTTNGDESDSEEAERTAEGQESKKPQDVDAETSKGAPKSREDEEEGSDLEESTKTTSEVGKSGAIQVAHEYSDSSATGVCDTCQMAISDGKHINLKDKPKADSSDESTITQESEADEQADETELIDEQTSDYEQIVEGLNAKVESLEEENTRLRKALHRTLAERVVDAKIANGIVESTERANAIEEHASRTASSLADSLRDFAKIVPKKASNLNVEELEMDQNALVVEGEENVITNNDTDEQADESKSVNAEDIFVAALMGRRIL